MDRSAATKGGRQAQAAANDERIRAAAREVFLADPGASIAAVGKAAGVGMSALYRRYASKEELLRRICTDGMHDYMGALEAASTHTEDRWQAFESFMRAAVAADSGSLTARLAGTFTPTPEMYALAEALVAKQNEFFESVRAAGVLRADIAIDDFGPLIEAVTSLRVGDAERTRQLRGRYIEVVLAGLRAGAPGELPGPPPTWAELSGRWNG